MRLLHVGAVLAGAVLSFALPAPAEPVTRDLPAAGAVIARKSGEEVRFFEVASWRYVDLKQDLLSGDVLRTNATGQLAVLFNDRTQVRLGRNTSLLLKDMKGGAETGLELQSGTIWARAERGGQGLAVDTPAATAAIRGTDWTLTVDAGGRTSLIVLEGLVELKNAQGSVQVAEGEAAVAAIGQAPRKVVIVDPKDREQMLFYLQLRDSFVWMPASPLPVRTMRAEKQRIAATAPESRTAEDWLTLAEVNMTLNGRQDAGAALAEAEARGLSRSQKGRATLIAALIAGSERRYADAARLFTQAAGGLDPERRSIAAYGGYYARSLADPDHVEPPPAAGNGPYGALAQAWTAGFLKDIKSAVDILKTAEARYPGDPTLPAARAHFAMLIDDREQMKEATERALSIDPHHPLALEARAAYRSGYESDLNGAIESYRAALAVSPGSTSSWNGLGLSLAELGDGRNAEAALKQSIALDPQDPLGHVNLAVLYLDQGRVREAKREIDAAMAEDPSFDAALIVRGHYYMQTGELDKAMEDLLAGSTANPGFSQAQLLLAAIHYETGNVAAAAQALDNADRLDPNDYAVSAVRTAIAIDDYDSDGAIRSAQDYLQRARARGGRYGALSANQDAGSTLNNAFRLQGLDAWGQFYGDVVFDPFTGSSFVDQTLRGSPNPFANDFSYGDNTAAYSDNSRTFSSFMQGLMLDPHMLAGRSRAANLLRRPFIEGSIGGTFTKPGGDGDTGWIRQAEVQGYSNTPVPFSFYANADIETRPDTRIFNELTGGFVSETELRNGTAYATASPTPNDHVVGFYSRGTSEQEYTVPLYLFFGETPVLIGKQQNYNRTGTNAGLAWSHSFGYRNTLNTAVFYTDAESDSRDIGVLVPFIVYEDYGLDAQRSVIGALNHTVGDDDLTWRYGIEGGTLDVRSQALEFAYAPPDPDPVDFTISDVKDEITIGRAYLDALYEITPALTVEAALFGSYLSGETVDVKRAEPRIGVAWSPAEGQWLRAGYMREGFDIDIPTLAPIGMVGLQSNQRPLDFGGYADTFAARWEAEWTARFFTAVDFQHQRLHGMSIDIPLDTETIDLAEGRIDRVSVTANLALGHGFGLSATGVYANSENRDETSAGFGKGLPYVPETAAQVALTWVNTNNLRTTIAVNYTGKRQGGDTGLEMKGYWTVDARLEWEPFDKRFAVDLAAYNLLDQPFEVTPFVPGWGRTYMGSVKVRF